MGIQGLLPLLKSIHQQVWIGNFSGQTVGIDAYCWLHKGAYGCAMDLAQNKDSSVYVSYVMRRVNMLLYHNIKPILVFDGGYLPSKSGKEKERRLSRQKYKAKGMEFLRAGNKMQAVECFQKCVDITPQMALKVMQECRKKGVDCIVAPYEADAQLAYLMKTGVTQLTITEDSDLLLFGATKVLVKMDVNGHGTLIDLEDLPKLKEIRMDGFTQERFRQMCILSGCDYLPSVKGMGLMTAHKMFRKFHSVEKVIKNLRSSGKIVPDDYEEGFKQADQTFCYQLVFEPKTQELVPLNPIPDHLRPEDLLYAGQQMSKSRALGIALGNIDPISGKVIGSFDPAETVVLNMGKGKQQLPEKNVKASNISPIPVKDGLLSEEESQETPPTKTNKTRASSVQRNLEKLLLNAAESIDVSKTLPPKKRKRQVMDNDDEEDESEDISSQYTFIRSKRKKFSLASVDMAPVISNSSTKHKFKNPFRSDLLDETPQLAPLKKSRYFGLSSMEVTCIPEHGQDIEPDPSEGENSGNECKNVTSEKRNFFELACPAKRPLGLCKMKSSMASPGFRSPPSQHKTNHFIRKRKSSSQKHSSSGNIQTMLSRFSYQRKPEEKLDSENSEGDYYDNCNEEVSSDHEDESELTQDIECEIEEPEICHAQENKEAEKILLQKHVHEEPESSVECDSSVDDCSLTTSDEPSEELLREPLRDVQNELPAVQEQRTQSSFIEGAETVKSPIKAKKISLQSATGQPPRLNGLSRCKRIGLSKRKTDSTNSKSTILNYFSKSTTSAYFES